MRFIIALITALSAQSFAGTTQTAETRATESRTEVAIGLSNMQIRVQVQKALDVLVRTAVLAVAERGETAQAQEIERQWLTMGPTLLDYTERLGDHRPLNAWLATTYRTLEIILGPTNMQAMHLDDINVVNYALPVVVAPHQNWGEAEYGRHFIPLAGVVAFWASYGACMYEVSLPPFCSRLSGALKGGMIGNVAPQLSIYVYRKAHQ